MKAAHILGIIGAGVGLAWGGVSLLRLGEESAPGRASAALTATPGRALSGEMFSPEMGEGFLIQLNRRLDAVRRGADAGAQDSLLAWALARDPVSALRFLSKGDEWAQELARRLLREWAARDPAVASDFASSLPASIQGDSARLGEAYEALKKDPRRALELASDLPSSRERDAMIAQAVSEWAARDSAAAAAWAQGIADPALRSAALAAISTTWAEADPLAAANLALDSLSPGPVQDRALVGIIQRWTQQDAASAAAWVAQFPEGSLRRNAITNLVKLWTEQDLSQPGDWLNSLPDTPSAESGIRAYAEQLTTHSPSDAVAWAETIANTALRNLQLEQIFQVWLQNDAGQARLGIGQSTLPADAKARLLGGGY